MGKERKWQKLKIPREEIHLPKSGAKAKNYKEKENEKKMLLNMDLITMKKPDSVH